MLEGITPGGWAAVGALYLLLAAATLLWLDWARRRPMTPDDEALARAEAEQDRRDEAERQSRRRHATSLGAVENAHTRRDRRGGAL